MTSAYGIISITDLEAFTGQDYSTYTDAAGTNGFMTDTVVEAQISQAERMVIGYVHQTYDSSSAPAEVITVIKKLAKILCNNLLIENGCIQGSIIDEFAYFEASLIQRLAAEESEGMLNEVSSVEDYD